MVKKSGCSTFVAVVLLIAMLIFGTRCIGLSYNMEIHPDESKFFQSTTSLLNSLLDPEVEFKEVKEYPEGAYLFQLPFQALGVGIAAVTGNVQNPQLWGRISSVFYFALAAVLGMVILRNYLGKSRISPVIFGLTLCFSLYFIEHSKYGVGDMISLFLLMLILYLTIKSCDSDREQIWLLLAFAAAGAMTAVKYPQFVFGLIPLSVVFLDRGNLEKKRWKRSILMYFAVMFLVFLLFSPKAMFDWKYFYRVLRRESDAYLLSGTLFEAGGLLNHIAAMVLYAMLYSDFPMALLLLIAVFAGGWKTYGALFRSQNLSKEDIRNLLLFCVIPGLGLLFFTYNLVPTLLIFRTFTPYFGFSALYGAYAAGELVKKGGWRKWMVVGLTGFMVIRGCGLIGLTSFPDRIRSSFQKQVYEAVDENWNRTLRLGQYIIPFDETGLVDPVYTSVTKLQESNDGSLELKPGTLAITGAYPFAFGSGYILPGETRDADDIALWQEFMDLNGEYFVAQAYPDYVYYLYGGWIRGGTLSTSMIPCNYIFYHP